ncbi:hypothetical protein ACYU0V_13030 [Acinetobacter sp. X9]
MKKLNFFRKNLGPNELMRTIFLSLIFYTILVLFAIGIGLILTKTYGTESKDVPSVISNMFVWSATLIAPIIAILLLNSWRFQKNYEANFELLNTAEENIIRFKNEIDPICKTIIKIYDLYQNNNEDYYLANSLYKDTINEKNPYLLDFYINITRYLNYNEDEELASLINEFYEIANNILYINKDIINDHYFSIYKLLRRTMNEPNDTDLKVSIIFTPKFKSDINKLYSIFSSHFINCTFVVEPDSKTGFMKRERKTYNEYYILMNLYYTKINNMIKNKNRA